MVDIIRTVKSIMDAHGAWIFGGAVLGALTAHVHKKRSFDADWFQVTCYGCGRSGFSDEFAGVTTPDGRPAYQCVRCQRPDLFKQAEGVDYSTIVYRVRITDLDNGYDAGENHHYRTMDRAMEHVNNVIKAYDWYGFQEIPAAGERRKWKTTSEEDWEILMTPVRLGNIVREAETANAEIIRMQAILPDGTVAETSIDHVDQLYWPGHLLDESAAKGGSMAGRFEGIEMPADSGHHCVVWSDPGATEPNAEASRLAGQPVFGTAVVYSVYDGASKFMAEDYGVGAVWMADSYDPAIHGNTIPTGSVKRFLDKIPMGQMFHVDFVKSNGDIREMDAFFNKPFDTDSMVANVMERTGTGAVFKRFRVDRVVGLYRI